MVLQETWLKTGTIKENIAYGRPDATDEEIIEAAKQSHAHSFIKRLPEGYDTMISEDGGGLSQGQKQLLCITRVMLDLPPMLILDEATSSIDTRTEIRIQRAFAKMMKGRTSFVVAHRLSTIKESDIILVPYFLAILIIASFVSVPEFWNRTFSIPIVSQIPRRAVQKMEFY